MNKNEIATVDSENTIVNINRIIKNQLGDDNVKRALLSVTFKGLDETRMKQALLEGMVRGFKFEDFLKKDVYALPFSDKYSIVQSIDFNRKIGMRNGIVGTKKPVYVTEEDIIADGNTKLIVSKKIRIISCELTVLKRFDNGYIGEFTAEVFFDEYYKAGKTYNGKYTPSMWDTKPRTMIAKVAEMHALRKACPEELAQAYVEEEFDREIQIEEESPKGRFRNAKSESKSLKIVDKKINNTDEKNKIQVESSEDIEIEEDESEDRSE